MVGMVQVADDLVRIEQHDDVLGQESQHVYLQLVLAEDHRAGLGNAGVAPDFLRAGHGVPLSIVPLVLFPDWLPTYHMFPYFTLTTGGIAQ
jgi:hypothetical protein